MIPPMDELSERNPLVLWSFWLACGLALTGGIAPLLLAAGGPDRIGGAIIPFTVGAGAMGANALLYQRGRPLAAALYFLAGIALVYGMLAMFTVPLRLAVLGTCPALPAVCPAGLEREFSSGESTGFTVGVFMGVLSILAGFFGLLMLYRRRPKAAAQPMWTSPAPEAETSAAQAEVAPAAATESAPEAVAAASPDTAAEESPAPMVPERQPVFFTPPPTPPGLRRTSPPSGEDPTAEGPASPPKAVRKPRAKRAPKPPLELPPPESHLELPASSSPAEEGSDTPSST
jgi:hypothetical protein